MSFQIHALEADQFRDAFALDQAGLDRIGAQRMEVTEHPGFPCRVSLAEGEVGDTVILLNHEHLPANSPYRSRHAIFVRDGVETAHPAVGDVPSVLASRLLSVRGFGSDHMMRVAEVVEGRDLARELEQFLADPETAYVHIHFARRGCYAAAATRPGDQPAFA